MNIHRGNGKITKHFVTRNLVNGKGSDNWKNERQREHLSDILETIPWPNIFVSH